MEATDLPEVRFDLEMGAPIYPRPVPKHAIRVPIPRTEDGSEIPTFIKPEWGGVQVFYGDYYGIVVDGILVYGSAKEQWEAMHTHISPGYWVKTAVPMAYQATQPCRIVTIIPSEDGGIREASNVVETGDWVVRQPGGEVQRIKAKNYSGLYFTAGEAAKLGLTAMTHEQFASWAVAQVYALVPSN